MIKVNSPTTFNLGSFPFLITKEHGISTGIANYLTGSVCLYASVCKAKAAWSFIVLGLCKGLGFPANSMVLVMAPRVVGTLPVLTSLPCPKVPCPSSKSLYDDELPALAHLHSEGVDQFWLEESWAWASSNAASFCSHLHDPIIGVMVNSVEKMHPSVFLGKWYSIQNAFCGNGNQWRE